MMMEVRDVTKHYPQGRRVVRALNGVSLKLHAGEFVSIMGPSGSGKSTLMHLLGGLDTPTNGKAIYLGRDLAQMSDRERSLLRRTRIGFVFQFFNLLPSLTAEENVTLPAVIAKRHDPAIRERARALIERVGLGDRIDHLPSELSGGQQQRVSIARALLLEPDLILADEPTGNLDTRSGREVLETLRQISTDEGRTVVMVTHDPAAAAVADRVVFLRDGRVAGAVPGGSTQRVLDFFATLETDPAPVPAAPQPSAAATAIS